MLKIYRYYIIQINYICFVYIQSKHGTGLLELNVLWYQVTQYSSEECKNCFFFLDTSERISSMSQGDQSKGDCLNEIEASECEMEDHESELPCIAPHCRSTSQSKGNWCKRAKNRRHYTFTQPIENLHKGIPAYYSMDVRRSGDSPHADGFTRSCCALPSV